MWFFNENNFLNVFLLKLWDLILANLLFIFCSIPLVTIGPSFTALYHCTLRIVKGNNPGVFKTFFRSFRENFRQSVIVWLCTMFLCYILYNNIVFLRQTENSISSLLFCLNVALLIIIIFISLYIYPVIAAFHGNLKLLLKNAVLFAYSHFLRTLIMLFIWGLPLLITYLDEQLQPLYVFCWFFFLFSTLAYINSKSLYKMFQPYLEKSEKQTDES